MKITNLVPKISVTLVVLIVLYIVLFAMQPRLAPPTYGDSIDFDMAMIGVALPLSFFPAFMIGLWRAARARDYRWLALQIMFFPSSYIYTLLINKGEGANNSFKPKPLRGSA